MVSTHLDCSRVCGWCQRVRGFWLLEDQTEWAGHGGVSYRGRRIEVIQGAMNLYIDNFKTFLKDHESYDVREPEYIMDSDETKFTQASVYSKILINPVSERPLTSVL